MTATFSPRRALRHGMPWLLLVALVGLSVRYVWTLSGLETGWAMQREEWAGAANRLIGRGVTPLDKRLPAEQAGFWTRELSRIDETARDARLAIGAAWILHAPQMGYRARLMTYHPERAIPGLPIGTRFDLDMESIRRLEDEFETIAAPTCLALAETATRLEPGNVDHWRARALMLFEQAGFLELKPRRADWLEVLDECRRHDPDNALYDHLAALALWTASATYGIPSDNRDDGFELQVSEEAMFQQAVARFEEGLRRPRLLFETDLNGPAATVLDQADLSPFDRLDVIQSRPLGFAISRTVLGLVRWQKVRKDSAVRAGRLEDGVEYIQQIRRMTDQLGETEWYPNLAATRGQARLWALASLVDLSRKHAGLTTAENAAAIERELNDVRLEMAALQEVGRRMTERYRPSSKASFTAAAVALTATQLSSLVVMAAIATSLGLIGRWVLNRRVDPAARRSELGRAVGLWLLGSLLGGAVVLTQAGWRGRDADESRSLVTAVQKQTGISELGWQRISTVVSLSHPSGAWSIFGGSLVVSLVGGALPAWRHRSGGGREWLRQSGQTVVPATVCSVLTSAVIGLIVFGCGYLLVVPTVARYIEAAYQRRLDWPQFGPKAAAEVAAFLGEVRDDREVMQRLQRQIDERERKVREQEEAQSQPVPSEPPAS